MQKLFKIPHKRFSNLIQTQKIDLIQNDMIKLTQMLDNDPKNIDLKNQCRAVFSLQTELNQFINEQKETFRSQIEHLDYLKQKNIFIKQTNNDQNIVIEKIINQHQIQILFKHRNYNNQLRNEMDPKFSYQDLKENFDEIKNQFSFIDASTNKLPNRQKEKDEWLKDQLLDQNNPFGKIQNDELKYLMLIENNSKENRLLVQGFTYEQEVHISKLYICEEIFGKSQDIEYLDNNLKKLYGVNFCNLSNHLQKNFVDYIESFQIEAEIFYHMEHLSYHKYLQNNINWLIKNLQSLIQ